MENTRTTIFLILLFVWSSAGAQVIPFDNYYVQDGLESNMVLDIEQDNNGYLWFATPLGAAKFDGYTFYPITKKNGLPDNNVHDIFIDSKERIWFATENGGLAVLQNNQFKIVDQKQGLLTNLSKEVFEDKNGNIWYTSYRGISIIKPDTIINFSEENSPVVGEIYATYVAFDSSVWFSTLDHVFRYRDSLEIFQHEAIELAVVRTITEDKKGSFWFGTEEKGVIHITGKKTVILNSLNGLVSDIVIAITPVKKDEVLVGTTYPGGIYRIQNNQVTHAWTSKLEDFVIWNILVDHKGRIWAQTGINGIILIEKGQLTNITKLNNLSDNQPSKIFEDRNSNIWISTYNGLSKYGKIIFQIYNQGLIDNDNIVYGIAKQGNKIYLGTLSGLNILEENHISHYITDTKSELNYPNIYSILPLSEKEIWLGTYYGLSQLKNNRIYFFPDSVFNPNENDITYAVDLEYVDGSIYCATALGLIVYKNGKYFAYTKKDGLIHDGVWSVKADTKKNIWCATVNGLSIFDGHQFHNYNTSSGLPDNYCNDIAFDSRGFGYVATENGLAKVILDDDWTITCDNFNKEDGLGSERLLLVIADKTDHIWVGHTKGIDKLDINTRAIKNYGTLEGFLPIETNQGAVTLGEGNDIWFGTTDGAVRYIPDNDVIDKNPPEVHITSVELQGDQTPIEQYADSIDISTLLPIGLKLKYNSTLRFKFVGIHYTIIEKNEYRYMMEGFDPYWLDPVKETEALYRRIPPGKYRFKVLASNCDGIWSSKAAFFDFEVRPPFWSTWWFHVLEALAALGIIILIIRYRERKLRHDREVLAQKVRERTAEIARQRDQIALQKQEITDSIRYAERIQSAVLPKDEYIAEWLNDYFILFKPRDIVSGDYYWVNGTEKRVMVVAADCTGHGVPGAFMSMLGVSILNEIATESDSIEAGEILDLLRKHLTSTLWQTGNEEDAKDGMDMVLSIFDFKKLKLQFAAAYNPLVIIRDGEIIVHKADRMPVGYHPEEMPPFKTNKISLKKGDCLYMFSDGYADQFGGPEGKKFKSVTLRELLLEISQLPMNEQKERLNETIMNWMGINEQVDDILVMGIRV